MSAAKLPVGPTCTPCVICARASRGFAFISPANDGTKIADFCSNECVEIFMSARANDVTLTPAEAQAVKAAAMGAGKFAANTIGKTDLAAMSLSEYLLYAGEFQRIYTDTLRSLARDQVPF
jgi:hypothetical protein